MQSITFKGRDFYDLDKQEFDWRSDHPNVTILQRRDEELQIDDRRNAYANDDVDLVQRWLDYDD